MSQALITRRIVGDLATRQIISRTSSLSSPTFLRSSSICTTSSLSSLTFSLNNLSINGNKSLLPAASTSVSVSAATSSSSSGSCHFFSSMIWHEKKKKKKAKPTIVELPPNLKFDPRSTASPFYGLEPISGPGKTKKKEATNNAATTSEAIETANDETQDYEDDDDEDEDEDDENLEEESNRILYDLTTSPPRTPIATPLPDRLHIPIHSLPDGPTSPIGTLHLSPQTFGCDPIRIDILHRCVVYQRNKKRGKRNAGARTKTISEVRGSTRKVRQQKGMGRARAGHSRPAHWRGGAKAHGPKGAIQDYTTKLNKKVRKLGVRNALSQKLKEGNLIVVGDMNVKSHKTRVLNDMLERFGVSGKYGDKALLIDDAKADEEAGVDASAVYGGLNVNLTVASGNLKKVKVLNQLGCNVYDLLKFRKVFLSLEAVRSLEERLERDL